MALTLRAARRGVDPLDFRPDLLRLQGRPPHPLARAMLWLLLALFAAALAWAALARLDIVAVAPGKLVPSSYLKIVQPAEQGIVREILVREGALVDPGQVLLRMDAVVSEADRQAVQAEFHMRRLALRRVEAELADAPFAGEPDDPPQAYAQALAQYRANRAAHDNRLAQERTALERARHDLAAAEQTRAKLERVLPHYREQEQAFEKLAKDGFAGRMMATDKARERIEREQDLRVQEAVIAAAQAGIAQAERRLRQVEAEYRRQLQDERAQTAARLEQLTQELAKLDHRRGLLELKAPQAGVVKELATHTPGAVVGPGSILMTLVPRDETLRAEVWVSNEDIGFVRAGQPVKLKLAAYPFQKYGMLDGAVAQVSADAQDRPAEAAGRPPGLIYRALVDLAAQSLDGGGALLALTPGMQVTAEIRLGTRSVLEYLLSPVQKAWHEAGRER